MTGTKTCALIISLIITLAGTAIASAAPSNPYDIAVSGRYSDSNMRWARNRIDENIDMLQHDQRDYGGYRVKAISLFQSARQQVSLGLAYDGGREDVPPVRGFVRPDNDMVYIRGARASDVNLSVVRRNIENIMDVLARDNHDYGGHRAAALRLLGEGRQMIARGLTYDRGH